MAEQEGQEKTEDPTDKKRDDARNEGQVAFSREVGSAALLAATLSVFYFMSSNLLEDSQQLFVEAFSNLTTNEITIQSVVPTIVPLVGIGGWLLLPFFAIAVIIGIFASIFQVGLRLTWKPLMPKFSKISPLSGIKRLFSTQGLVELFKSLFKITALGYIGYDTFEAEKEAWAGLISLPPSEIIVYCFQLLNEVSLKILLTVIALSVIDYFYQRWYLEQQLRMTKQEVKEENKQTEGDPHVKSRIRQVQREMARARMMQEVPKADAILTNPTHYSVAIRYDRETMTAPHVTAKGGDHLAQRMRVIARENSVPIVERPKLARELYNDVEVGEVIPDQFFRAVAEVLSYVYRLKGRRTTA